MFQSRRPPTICDCGEHAWGVLTRGFVTFVSPNDAGFLAARSWAVQVQKTGLRQYCRVASGKPRRFLAPLLAGAGPADVVDHRDGNPLNNRRSNLRLVTSAQNAWNRRPRANSATGYKGVSYRAKNKNRPWRAGIRVAGRQIELGSHATAEDAARAYNKAALELYGEFARLNEIKGE